MSLWVIPAVESRPARHQRMFFPFLKALQILAQAGGVMDSSIIALPKITVGHHSRKTYREKLPMRAVDMLVPVRCEVV